MKHKNPYYRADIAQARKQAKTVTVEVLRERLRKYRQIKQLPHERDWLDGYAAGIDAVVAEVLLNELLTNM